LSTEGLRVLIAVTGVVRVGVALVLSRGGRVPGHPTAPAVRM